MRIKYNVGIDNPKHKKHRTGLSLIKRFTNCMDCGLAISKGSKNGRCRSCAKKGRNHPNYGHTGYWLGKKRPEHSKKMKGSNHPMLGVSKKGSKNPFYGRSHTEETKKKISLSLGGTGIPYEETDYPNVFYVIRNSIRKRDNYECRICGIKQRDYYRKLDVHHIDYNKQNCAKENLITLCHNCHLNTNYNRRYWNGVFNNMEIL